MNVSQASKVWLDYHRAHSKENTVRAYEFTIGKFIQNIADKKLNEVSIDDILGFMTEFTKRGKPQTKRIRFSHLTDFYNFLRNNFDGDIQNPCDSPMLRKLFRPKAVVHWEIISKIILRHSSLQTTEIYLGKVSDTEAIRWIENLYS